MSEAPVLDRDQVLPVVPVLTAEDVVSETETVAEVLPVTAEAPTAMRLGRDEAPEVLPTQGERSGRNDDEDFDRKVSRIREGTSGGVAKHLLPLAILALLLLAVVAHGLWVDVRQPAGQPGLV